MLAMHDLMAQSLPQKLLKRPVPKDRSVVAAESSEVPAACIYAASRATVCDCDQYIIYPTHTSREIAMLGARSSTSENLTGRTRVHMSGPKNTRVGSCLH